MNCWWFMEMPHTSFPLLEVQYSGAVGVVLVRSEVGHRRTSGLSFSLPRALRIRVHKRFWA
jgi:hypothetical protein